MKTTPLHHWHVQRGAKMVDFAGWEMPLYYTSILDEHNTVRSAAGLFDVCHMGRLRIAGPQAFELVQFAFSNDVDSMPPGKAKYGVLCNPSAGVIDDAIIYRLEDAYLLIPNASNKDTVLEHLKTVVSERAWHATIEDLSESLGMFALQGPLSQAILQPLCEQPLEEAERFTIASTRLADIECQLTRTGYTGEDGFEIIAAADQIAALWSAIEEAGRDQGLKPAGLGARDSLRIEACLPLYGHELTTETNPLFAGLRPFVKLAKPDFIGKNAMLHWTLDEFTRFLVPFVMNERAVPRQGCTLHAQGEVVGEVTSGLFSPMLNQGVGMAYVDAPHAQPGAALRVRIRDKFFAATVAERPLYKAKCP